MDLDGRVTLDIVAHNTGYNIESLRRLCRQQDIDALRIGRVWYVHMASVRRYMKEKNAVRRAPRGKRKEKAG